MVSTTFEESKLIHATPKAVYDLLVDYVEGHKAILPKAYFVDTRVLEGGFGAGTLIEVDMDVFGVKRTLTMRISEPKQGRLLAETDINTGTKTWFYCEPHPEGCLLTIRTTMYFNDGIMGYIEKLTTPAITRSIYRKELQNIEDYLQESAQPV